MSHQPQKTWLIIGASRGIGHEFVRQLLERGDRVLATVRNRSGQHTVSYWTSKDAEVSQLTTLECDMLSEGSIDTCIAKIASIPDLHIHYAVLNAGILKYPSRASELSYDDFALHLHTNTVGPTICAQRLLKAKIPLKTIVFISSDSGSAQCFRDHEDGLAAYGASKVALNQMLRHMAAELKRKNDKTTILALHPGEVKTDMADSVDATWEVEGQMTPQESVSACMKVIESKGPEDNGTFWTWENRRYPW